MSSNSPIPPQRKRSSGLDSLVQAEKLTQIAVILPCCLLIGWGLGWWIDHHFGTHWAGIAGVVLGLAAGMVSVIKMALSAGNTPAPGSSKKPDGKP